MARRRSARVVPRTTRVESTSPNVPSDPREAAAWFLGGVESEIAALEKTGGTQNYELLTGTRLEGGHPGEAIYQFLIADGTRLPEDAEGRLRGLGRDFAASVISQQGNRVQVLVEGELPLPPGFVNATLQVDDTGLLRKLAEVLEELTTEPAGSRPLATMPFHPEAASIGSRSVSEVPRLVTIDTEVRTVLEQCCGSSLTYVWGPPGTGKTYAIARLVAALVHQGERVLMTSHTHAAIDKALYETVSNEVSGPLSGSDLVADGKVLRLGRVSDPKIPESVQLEKVLEAKSIGLQEEISALEAKARPLATRRAECRARLTQWVRLADLEAILDKHQAKLGEVQRQRAAAEQELQRIPERLRETSAELERARRAWWARARKVERTSRKLASIRPIRAHLKRALAVPERGWQQRSRWSQKRREASMMRVLALSCCRRGRTMMPRWLSWTLS